MASKTTVAAGTRDKTPIPAAGALCWRVYKSELQVLVIHRPRYEDWSWPKGKMDPRETIVETATREVWEEVGFTIRLGRRLPTLTYETNNGLKEVHYWAAHIPKGTQKTHVDGKEVDKAKWMSTEKASKILSRASDRIPLEALVRMHEEGTLKSRSFIILRHAKAKPRTGWEGTDGDRPLSTVGKRQAIASCQLLKTWHPGAVISSPWLRCVSTILPYLRSTDAKFETAEALTEAAYRKNTLQTEEMTQHFFETRHSTVLCVHRPTIPAIFQAVLPYTPSELHSQLPPGEPYLKPGEILVFQVIGGALSEEKTPRVLSIERYEPFSD